MIVRQTATRARTASLTTPHDSRPIKHYPTCTGAPATDVASIDAGIWSGNRSVFTNTPNADIIMCLLYTTTQRDVYILNFADTLYTLQLDAFTVVPFLVIWPLRHRSSGLYGHIFIAIAFFNINYLSPAGHPANAANGQGWMKNLLPFSQSVVEHCNL